MQCTNAEERGVAALKPRSKTYCVKTQKEEGSAGPQSRRRLAGLKPRKKGTRWAKDKEEWGFLVRYAEGRGLPIPISQQKGAN